MGYNSQFVEIWEGRPFVHVWQGRVQRDLRVNSGKNKQSDNSPGGGAFSPHVRMVPCILHLWVMLLYLAMTLGLVVNGGSAATLLMEIPAGLLYLCIPIIFFYFTAKLAFEEIPSKLTKQRKNSLYAHPMNCICPLCTMNLRCAQSSKHSRGGVKYTAFLFPPRQQTPDQRDALMVIENWNSLEVNRLLLVLAGDVEVNPGPITLHDLTEELEKLTKPLSFGNSLKVPWKVLGSIARNQRKNDIDGQKRALFEYIAINYEKHEITWTKIADALELIARDLAVDIRQKYCATVQSEETHNSSEDKMAESSKKDHRLKKPTGGAAKSVQVEGVYYCDSKKTTAEVRASLEVGGDTACGTDICFLAESEDKVLSIDTHLQPVRSSIWSTRSLWKEIGRALGISDDIIRTIHYTDDGECLNEVLSKWINSGKATISDLLRALANKTVDRNDIKNGIHVLKVPDPDALSDANGEGYYSFSNEENDANCLVLKDLITADVSPSHLYEAVYKGEPSMVIVYNPGEASSDRLKKAYTKYLDDMYNNRKNSRFVKLRGIKKLHCFPASPDYPVVIVEKNNQLVNFFASETSPVLIHRDQLSILYDITCAVCNFGNSPFKRVKVLENSLFISRVKDCDKYTAKFCPIFGYSCLINESSSPSDKSNMVDLADLEWIEQITLLLCWGKDLTSEKQIPSDHILRGFLHQWLSDIKIVSLDSVKSDLQMLLEKEKAHVLLKTSLSGGVPFHRVSHAHMHLIGAANVGKTSIRKHLKNEKINPHEEATIVAEHEVLCQETLEVSGKSIFMPAPEGSICAGDPEKVFLTLWDTGGHPMFSDLLPCFPMLRSIFAIVFRLCDSLDSIPVARTGEQPSYFKNLQLIKRFLSFIDTFASAKKSHLSQFPQDLLNVLNHGSSGILGSNNHALLIGTHNRKAAENPKKCSTFVEDLEEEIRPFLRLLKCPSDSPGYLYKVENSNSGTDTPDPDMCELRQYISNCARSATLDVPTQWWLFKVEIEQYAYRQKPYTGVVPYNVAEELAEQLGIDTCEAPLIFFHELGVFLWYYYFAKLRDIVVIDPKKLLTALSKLFNVSVGSIGGYSDHEQFDLLRRKGIVKPRIFHSFFDTNVIGLTSDWIEQFLREHYLMVPIKHPDMGDVFFIPSVIQHKSIVEGESSACPLHIVLVHEQKLYRKNITPGLFPRLITVLSSNNDRFEAKWEVAPLACDGCLCREQVEFIVCLSVSKEEHRVILTELSDSIEVRVSPNQDIYPTPTSNFCSHITSVLVLQLQKWLNRRDYMITFKCQSTTCRKRLPVSSKTHFYKSIPSRSPVMKVTCEKGFTSFLSDVQMVWVPQYSSEEITENPPTVSKENLGIHWKASNILFLGSPGADISNTIQTILQDNVLLTRTPNVVLKMSSYYHNSPASFTAKHLLPLSDSPVRHSLQGDSSNFNQISVIECGSHPAILEILPNFFGDNSLCLFVTDNSQSIDEHSLVRYYEEGIDKITAEFVSPLSNWDTIRYSSHLASKILIIGTHSGSASESCLVDSTKALVHRLNQWKDEVPKKFIQNDENPLFCLNATSVSSSEHSVLSSIRGNISSLVETLTTPSASVPYSWLNFGLSLQKVFLVRAVKVLKVSGAQLKSIATESNIDICSIHNILVHLSKHKIIFYFPDILPDVIFGSIEVFSDIVAEILRQKGRESSNHNALVNHSNFQQVEKHYYSGIFTAVDAVNLFRELFILAEYRKPTYIMSCLLYEMLPERELDKYRTLPLFFAVPKAPGIFCSLISSLTSSYNKYPYPWFVSVDESNPDVPKCLFRNCVQFGIPGFTTVTITLIDSLEYDAVEVHLSSQINICTDIHDAILFGLKNVLSVLNYNDIEPQAALVCKCRKVSRHHLALYDGPNWRCSLNNQSKGELNESERRWNAGVERTDQSSGIILKDGLTVGNVFRQLMVVADDWVKVGLLLNIDRPTLGTIAIKHRSNTYEALFETISCWLHDGKPEQKTIPHVLKALQVTKKQIVIKDSPLHYTLPVLVLGAGGAGKTTLCHVLRNRLSDSNLLGSLMHRFRNVSDVESHTSGIVQNQITSKTSDTNITLFDFAGQPEYYSSNSAIMRSMASYPGKIALIVIDLTMEESEMIRTIRYWKAFVYNALNDRNISESMLVVGTHEDCISQPRVKLSAVLQHVDLQMDRALAINARLVHSRGLTFLVELLRKKYRELDQNMHVGSNVLYSLIRQHFGDRTSCRLAEIMSHIYESDNSDLRSEGLLPDTLDSLSRQLTTLSNSGEFLYMENCQSPEEGWLIVDKDVLLHRFNGTVFAPANFKEYQHFANSTGVVPFSRIKASFPEFDPHMIVDYMKYFEFCTRVDDSVTLLFQNEADSTETFYFFPALVRLEAPEVKFKHHLKSGWFLKCLHKDQYFNTRFLHVFLLRLVFTFALEFEFKSYEESPVVQRRCVVWKSGMYWLDRAGVEVSVEMVKHTVILVCVGCQVGAETDSETLQLKVIEMILKAKEEFCKNVETKQSKIDPKLLPIDIYKHQPWEE